MATKTLSEKMKTVLLAADADGWIRKSDAPTNTSVALMDRGLVGHEVAKDRYALYPVYGHWLTDAGKAKVAELRRIADPAQAYTMAIAEYVVRDGNPDDVMVKAPNAPEIHAGDLIEIRQSGKRRWAMRVKYANHAPGKPSAVTGDQVRMLDGATTRTRSVFLKPSEYTIIERAKSAAKTVAAEQPREVVKASVKLTEAQIDVLHLLGAPEVLRKRYWMLRPHGRSLLAMRDRLYVERDSAELTEDGREAYLACQPTGRLPQEFADAWAGTTVLASEPIRATLGEPACLADAEADELRTPQLPTLDELVTRVALYGENCFKGERYRITDELSALRTILETLYREAGR